MDTGVQSIEINEDEITLRKCFSDIIQRKEISLDEQVIIRIIKKDLLIDYDRCQQSLKPFLIKLFLVCINSWPGWRKGREYFSGKLSENEWFDKLKQFLTLKLYTGKSEYQTVIDAIQKEKCQETSKRSTQTHYTTAPFIINITCNPAMISSITFTDSLTSPDNVFISCNDRQRRPNKRLNRIDNWPYVEVIFESPELMFTRKNVTEYKRYLGLTTTFMKHEKPEFLDSVELIKPQLTRDIYTLRYIEAYCIKYVDTLTHYVSSYGIGNEFLKDIKVILNEFLLDIADININGTMATNTVITFNIGKHSYVRVKNLTNSNGTQTKTDIGFCEWIIPKTEMGLVYFTALQDKTRPNISFTYLNSLIDHKIPKSQMDKIFPVIKYRCSCCDIKLSSGAEMYRHFKEIHIVEQNIFCYTCKTPFSLVDLCESRWNHNCKISV